MFKGGKVVFNSPGEAQKAGISVIYQELNLIRHLTVIKNIYLALTASLSSRETADLFSTMDEPGTGDAIGIQMLNKNGGTGFLSDWSGVKTIEQTY